MAKSCKGLAMELVKCLSETDCVKVQKRPYKECAGEKVPNITSECVGLRETYFNCKRGQRQIVCRAHKFLIGSLEPFIFHMLGFSRIPSQCRWTVVP
ncbi:hypothetical protein C2845_PM03G03420 [Panicum miliaceum]|uniref:Cytochrome c oxidase assembly factor 5 n=1 Tax=Panicum miliaceum TaxID=4540 RepID=A0A3L6T9Y8_PANMI|nr:hypothetical protein C2845_PM03G03420 [Panicum miliaceum]